ncbi:MAG: ABC transporter substrate-binding protein [Halolamina sp.]
MSKDNDTHGASKSRRWFLQSVGVGSSVAIAGCTGVQSGGEAETDATFIAAKNQPLTHLDPQAINDGTMIQLDLVYDQLLDYKHQDPTEVRPALATDYESQNGGEEWVLTLREGVEFSDGTSFDAYAAKRSLERAKALQAGQSKPYDWIDTVEETGDYEITIHCNGAFGPAPAALTFVTASIMNPTVLDEHKDEENLGHEYFKQNVHGTGAFEFESWDKGNEFVATRKTDDWRANGDDLPEHLGIPENANVGEYQNRIVREQLTQKQKVTQGDIDVSRDLTWTNIESAIENDGVELYDGPPDLYNKYVFMMCQREPTSEVNFRKALAYAADYESIAKELVNTGIPWGTPWAEGIWPRVTEGQYSRDLEKARSFLEKSNYDGRELKFRSIKGSENDKVGEALVANFDEVGITVDHEDIPWSNLYEQLTDAESMPDLLMYNGWPDYADPNGPAIRYWGDYWPPDGWNTAYYQNDEYDEMFEKARSSGDRAEREELYKQMQEILLDEVPIIWLFQNKYVRAYNADVEDLRYTPGEFNYLPAHQIHKEN